MKNKILKKIKNNYISFIKPLFSEKKVECPFCKWTGGEFLSFGVASRKNAKCPKCGSLERHSLYCLYLKNILPKDKNLKVLHFAPEKSLTNLFTSYENIDYLSVDINIKKTIRKEDITKLSFADNTFDIIFCSHVLEHIEDDIKAMKEVNRVLLSGGFAILQVPIKEGREKTLEDFSIKTPEEREKIFGQQDHVRIYGQDYVDRLKEAGFKVKIDNYYKTLANEDYKKYALRKEDIYFCKKSF